MKGTDQLLTLARTYAAAEGIELSTVSSRVFNDGKKLAAIEAGGDLYSSRLEAAMQWFSDRWPEATEWPADLRRPQRVSSSDEVAA